MLMGGIVVGMSGQSYGILADVQLFLEHVEKGDHFDGCRCLCRYRMIQHHCSALQRVEGSGFRFYWECKGEAF